MFSLNITDAAAKLIRSEVDRSGITKPVVHLVEASNGIPTARELEKMGASEEVRRKMEEMRSTAPNVERGSWKLLPCVYPRAHFLWLFLIEISGIVFFFPPQLRKKVTGGKLDVGCGALVLVDRSGRVVMPRPTYE
jgi:hypothetical protein